MSTQTNPVKETKEITKEDNITILDNSSYGKLNVLPIGTTIYIPYMDITSDIYEVREVTIEGLGEVLVHESGLINLYYICVDANGDKNNINLLGTIVTGRDEALDKLRDFLAEQVGSIHEHTEAIEKQLLTNGKNSTKFRDIIGNLK